MDKTKLAQLSYAQTQDLIVTTWQKSGVNADNLGIIASASMRASFINMYAAMRLALPIPVSAEHAAEAWLASMSAEFAKIDEELEQAVTDRIKSAH